ncbi:nicotinate-nucleotide--dimethylbenzimidazole phosphoribosyltransferase [Vallitalea okinawensis]|uniref:nicotinate-nucleotide--dimethylbenzimidazole phosphoribosyltransferase n=1 Tax=Vallitalea okinawensis TaxID=2078660 RepID=UPI000CFB5C30|nr:nicotinate-nucleotide--dimethylbenzimidazole phosphoribosyltransferase [Vallitalea okinawensis]
MQTLEKVLKGIQPLDQQVLKDAESRVDFLAKPIGSLGKLEKLAIQVAGITGSIHNQLDKKCTVVMAADNGVWDEGIAITPQHITAVQTISMLKGIAGISVLSKQAGADLRVVDIGIKSDVNYPGLVQRKIRKGTRNLAIEPAMTHDEVVRAIEVGIHIVKDLVDEGYKILGTGEMGIGNTTTSAAIVMALSGCSADLAVGKGAGLTDEGLINKKSIITKALNYHSINPSDPIDALAKVGGLDIAGLVGCFLGAAYYKIPIVIDGVISAAAAYTAFKISPISKNYMIPSHSSLEPAYERIMKEMGMEPMLLMDMRLGEGTGCPLAFSIIDSAMAMMDHMGTFKDIELDTDYLIDIR